jgi:hypothetical protein
VRCELRLHVSELLYAVLLLKRFQLFADALNFVKLHRKLFFFRLEHWHHLQANFDFVFFRNAYLFQLRLGLFNDSAVHFGKPVAFFLLGCSRLRLREKLFVLDIKRQVFG